MAGANIAAFGARTAVLTVAGTSEREFTVELLEGNNFSARVV